MTRTHRPSIFFSAIVLVLFAGTAPAGERTDSASAEEARFQAAERLYQQKLYPQAADAYQHILTTFRNGCHQKQIGERLFDIAGYWLRDTWEQTRQVSDFNSPDWLLWVYPYDDNVYNIYSEILPAPRELFKQTLSFHNVFHWDESKPFLGEETRAVEVLELVYKRDPAGPLADKALFLMGHIAWFREDWRQADKCFSRLYKRLPNSKYAPFALELAIKTKLMHINEEDADYSHQLAEAKKMILTAQRRQDISEEKKMNLIKLLSGIYLQQAEMAFKKAEKRQLAGRMEQAYLQYALVRREFPGTSRAMMATERMLLMRPRLPKKSSIPASASRSRR
ncbi:MAG TPA: hypothetical protein VH643_41230 [Gemmataceae bacterium]